MVPGIPQAEHPRSMRLILLGGIGTGGKFLAISQAKRPTCPNCGADLILALLSEGEGEMKAEAVLFLRFRIVLGLRTLAQKTHIALSNPEPRVAVHVISGQLGLLLSICGLTPVFVIAAHALLHTAPATVQLNF